MSRTSLGPIRQDRRNVRPEAPASVRPTAQPRIMKPLQYEGIRRDVVRKRTKLVPGDTPPCGLGAHGRSPGSRVDTLFAAFPDLSSGRWRRLSGYSCGGSSGFGHRHYRIPFLFLIRNHAQKAYACSRHRKAMVSSRGPHFSRLCNNRNRLRKYSVFQ